MSAVSSVSNVDWPIVATAVATFIGTLYVSLKGLQKGKEKVEGGHSSITSIVGASIIDNMSIRDLSDSLKENTVALREHTRELQRQNDLILIAGRVRTHDD